MATLSDILQVTGTAPNGGLQELVHKISGAGGAETIVDMCLGIMHVMNCVHLVERISELAKERRDHPKHTGNVVEAAGLSMACLLELADAGRVPEISRVAVASLQSALEKGRDAVAECGYNLLYRMYYFVGVSRRLDEAAEAIREKVLELVEVMKKPGDTSRLVPQGPIFGQVVQSFSSHIASSAASLETSPAIVALSAPASQPGPAVVASSAAKSQTTTADRAAQRAYSIRRRHAEERGDTESQYAVGYCLKYGEGVAKNPEEAVSWFCKSASNGNPRAQHTLGECYERGEGVEKCMRTAAAWYHRSADQGYARAALALGLCFENGTGVVKDLGRAHAWYRMSARQGSSSGRKRVELFMERLREGRGR